MKASCLIHSERGEGGRPLGGDTQGGQDRLLLSLTLEKGHLGPARDKGTSLSEHLLRGHCQVTDTGSVLTALRGDTS
ncbi:hypothetical protein E2C01_012757 [Portunus trituberculatus]|uniref:Uncharacterized protein n=1 Tax=Portunus trituberculatus TaxID=210409 RepID=A0A5B7DF38_PORTR|nr:hypothetical protein [Portunus trituberculatus]